MAGLFSAFKAVALEAAKRQKNVSEILQHQIPTMSKGERTGILGRRKSGRSTNKGGKNSRLHCQTLISEMVFGWGSTIFGFFLAQRRVTCAVNSPVQDRDFISSTFCSKADRPTDGLHHTSYMIQKRFKSVSV